MPSKTEQLRPSEQITSVSSITKTAATHYLTEWISRVPDGAMISGHQSLLASYEVPVTKEEEQAAQIQLLSDFISIAKNSGKPITEDDWTQLQLAVNNLFS